MTIRAVMTRIAMVAGAVGGMTAPATVLAATVLTLPDSGIGINQPSTVPGRPPPCAPGYHISADGKQCLPNTAPAPSGSPFKQGTIITIGKHCYPLVGGILPQLSCPAPPNAATGSPCQCRLPDGRTYNGTVR